MKVTGFFNIPFNGHGGALYGIAGQAFATLAKGEKVLQHTRVQRDRSGGKCFNLEVQLFG